MPLVEAKFMNAPKSYVEIIKSSISIELTPLKNIKIDIKIQRHIQLEVLHKDKLKLSITLLIKDAPLTLQNAITEMSNKDIVEYC